MLAMARLQSELAVAVVTEGLAAERNGDGSDADEDLRQARASLRLSLERFGSR